MRRRDFVRVAAGGLAAATISSGATGCARDRPPFHRWTWVHGGGDRSLQEWKAQYGRLAEAGFHGVLVSGGDTDLHSEASHDAGLEFHRWIWTLNRSGDRWVQNNHPEWFTVSRRGDSSLTNPPYVGYYKWLCPTRSTVREYLQARVSEIASDPGVDGVHLDYVRHCDVILPRGLWEQYDLIQDVEHPEFDFCYCEVCREAFASLHGEDPLGLPDPPSDERWRRFRWDSVTGLVEILAGAVHEAPASNFGSALTPADGGKTITAAVFPTPSIARTLVRQAWDEWPLDAVFPMLYHSFYVKEIEWIGRGIAEGLRAMAARPPGSPSPRRLYAGLYLPALSPEGRTRATDVAREAGAQGVSFFEMAGLDV